MHLAGKPWSLISQLPVWSIASQFSDTFPDNNLQDVWQKEILGAIGFILLTWVNFNSAWISHHLSSEVYGEIINPFLNFNGCTSVHLVMNK